MAQNQLFIAGPANPVAETVAGFPSPAKEIDVQLALRTRTLTPETTASLSELLSQAPHQRRYLTHDEVAAATGGYPEDAAAVEAYFKPFNIRVTATNLVLGQVTLTGSVADFERALRMRVAAFETPSQQQFLGVASGYTLPDSLRDVVQPYQPQPLAQRKESRLRTPPPPELLEQLQATAGPPPVPGRPVPDFARAYQFPPGATGAGQVIGLVELGGQLNQAGLEVFFGGLGLPVPQVVEVGTPPASTGDAEFINNAEVALDVQLAGTLAPQARLVIYYGTTLLDALRAVVSDQENKPSVLSVSWAGAEANYSPQEVQQLSLLLYQASLLGITVVAASADFGAYNGQRKPNVSLLASSPLVLGCGGTIATLGSDDAIVSEVVWNELGGQVASGGGYSACFPQPYYQAAAAAHYAPYPYATQRGVPDVAANASQSVTDGYRVLVAGKTTQGGGTSAATPVVASLLALLNEQLGYRLGFVNAVLYSLAGSAAFRQITEGNNNFYPAAPLWNPCTGLGSLAGTELLTLLRQTQWAGQRLHEDSSTFLDEPAAQPAAPGTASEPAKASAKPTKAPAAARPQPGADKARPSAKAAPTTPAAPPAPAKPAAPPKAAKKNDPSTTPAREQRPVPPGSSPESGSPAGDQAAAAPDSPAPTEP